MQPVWLVINVPTTTGTLQVFTGAGAVTAIVMEETTGSASARFQLYDGTNTQGAYLGPYTLAEGQSFDSVYPKPHLRFRAGLFLNVTSGSVGGAIQIVRSVGGVDFDDPEGAG